QYVCVCFVCDTGLSRLSRLLCYLYLCMSLCVCVCVCVCVRACVCACVRACVCACVRACARACVHDMPVECVNQSSRAISVKLSVHPDHLKSRPSSVRDVLTC